MCVCPMSPGQRAAAGGEMGARVGPGPNTDGTWPRFESPPCLGRRVLGTGDKDEPAATGKENKMGARLM